MPGDMRLSIDARPCAVPVTKNPATFVHTPWKQARPNGLEPMFQKGGVPAAPSGTATLLRLSPNHSFHPRPLLDGHGLQAPRAFMA